MSEERRESIFTAKQARGLWCQIARALRLVTDEKGFKWCAESFSATPILISETVSNCLCLYLSCLRNNDVQYSRLLVAVTIDQMGELMQDPERYGYLCPGSSIEPSLQCF